MLKDVAVVHEGVLAICRVIEGYEKLGFVFDENSVLPTGEMSWRRRSLDGQDAKQCAVNMKRMRYSD